MIEFKNTQKSFRALWLELDRAYDLCHAKHQRFCIRHVMGRWFPKHRYQNLMWEVCLQSELGGWDELPAPVTGYDGCRYFLAALVAVINHTDMEHINMTAIDKAHQKVFAS